MKLIDSLTEEQIEQELENFVKLKQQVLTLLNVIATSTTFDTINKDTIIRIFS